MHPFIVFIIGILLAGVAAFLWRRWRIAQINAFRREAMQVFGEQRPDLAALFLEAASATGKPRGLRWKHCELSGTPHFAIDRVSGELYALLTATISFEAIAGGDMEDVEAVGNLRCATAIFSYRDQSWTSDGRAVFNLEPAQSLERFQETLQEIQSIES